MKASFVQLIMCYLLLTKCRQDQRTGRLLATCGNCSCTNGCENARSESRYLNFRESNFSIQFSLANEIMNVIKPGQHGSTLVEIQLRQRLLLLP
jgi:hypothetical protein